MLNNLQGLAYAVNPFEGKPKSFADLAQLMSMMWVSSVVEGYPNGHGVECGFLSMIMIYMGRIC